jgi:hypothetical protein
MANNNISIGNGEFNKLEVSQISVSKDPRNITSGIIDTNKLNADTEIQTDTLYCKSLIVTDNLYIPVENMPSLYKKRVTINRVGGNKRLDVNLNMGKLSYDGTLKDLKSTTNTGDKRSVTDTNMNITNNSRFKDNIILRGWSPDTNEDTSLYRTNGSFIDLDEHLYYQGCGYAIGFNNPTGESPVFQPIAFMSRIDYFVVTIDSFSNINSFPVNFLNISLYNNIGTDLRMNVIRKDSQYKLDVVVNSNKEVRWFIVLNLKKIYISSATDHLVNDNLKYSTSDNLINWQPVIETSSYSEICFKFIEELQFVHISPFSGQVIDETTTYTNSVIDDSLVFRPKTVGYQIEGDESSVNEVVRGNMFIDRTSSSFPYNIYGYHASILIQPTLDNTKKMTTSYAHTIYVTNEDRTTVTATLEKEFGNSFSKEVNLNTDYFTTSYIKNADASEFHWNVDGTTKITNNMINYVFQLKEKEVKYQPTLAVVYYRLFCAKAYSDASDSIIHRDKVFELRNIHDLTENISVTLQLYKYIGNFEQNVSKQIFVTQKDTDPDVIKYFDTGTHHFIKSYINIRDITNKKSVFCTHYASIILPTYSTMRQYFTELCEDGITDLSIIKSKFIEKYRNTNTIINEVDMNSYEEEIGPDISHNSTATYINSTDKKYISNNTPSVSLLKYNIKIDTEPVFEENIVNTSDGTVITNSTTYGTAYAYKTFDIKFPIKVMCTASNTSKYQTYIMVEINKFKIDTY